MSGFSYTAVLQGSNLHPQLNINHMYCVTDVLLVYYWSPSYRFAVVLPELDVVRYERSIRSRFLQLCLSLP
jgi:hypothetical protein